MFQAAICEDERDIARYIEKTLAAEFNKVGLQVSFDVFHNGKQLLEMINEHYHYDMIFMDIEMPEVDGISICKRIREINTESLVIFISNKEELVFSSFEVQPFRFIRKSHYNALLSSLVEAIHAELSRMSPNMLQIVEPRSRDIYSFDINQITYIEAQGKNCRINSMKGSTTIKIKLMELEEQLRNYEFLKPHRSYLVNYKYISSVHKSDIEMTNGDIVPISRGNAESIKKEYIKYTNRSL
ncbi:MAG: response regulator transcription factor [Blautia sp.]|nr:response regulator transcription factor [Blautia sp.]